MPLKKLGLSVLALIIVLLVSPAAAQARRDTLDTANPDQGRVKIQPQSEVVSDTLKAKLESPDKSDFFNILLLALILAVSGFCVYLLYFKLIRPISSLERFIREGLPGQLKAMQEKISGLDGRSSEIKGSADRDQLHDLSGQMSSINSKLQEIESTFKDDSEQIKQCMAKISQLETPPGLDLSPVLQQISILNQNQNAVLAALNHSKTVTPPRPEPTKETIEPVCTPQLSDLDIAIHELDARFKEWLEYDSLRSDFLCKQPLGEDSLYGAAPQRNNLLSEYKLSVGNTRYAIDECFMMDILSGQQKRGIVISIQQPAIILLSSYGQTELKRKGSLTRTS